MTVTRKTTHPAMIPTNCGRLMPCLKDSISARDSDASASVGIATAIRWLSSRSFAPHFFNRYRCTGTAFSRLWRIWEVGMSEKGRATWQFASLWLLPRFPPYLTRYLTQISQLVTRWNAAPADSDVITPTRRKEQKCLFGNCATSLDT